MVSVSLPFSPLNTSIAPTHRRHENALTRRAAVSRRSFTTTPARPGPSPRFATAAVPSSDTPTVARNPDGWWTKNETSNMVNVKSMQEFTDLLASAGDRLVIAEFYAPWCGACKGVYPKVAKIIKENPEIILAKLDFEVNKPLAKALNVRVLPFFIFYRGADGKVDQFSASLSKIAKFRDAVETYGAARCPLGELPNRGEEALDGIFTPRVRPLGDIMGSRVEGREGGPQSNPAAGKVLRDHAVSGTNVRKGSEPNPTPAA